MRSKAKHQGEAGRGYRALTALLVASVAFASLALLATAPALAGTVTNQRPFLFAFNGHDTTAGRFQLLENGEGGMSSIAVDNSTHAVYVANDQISVCKFNPDGSAASFSATGASCLLPSSPFRNLLEVAVDNSLVNPGRLYVSQFGDTRLNAFDPAGNLLWTLEPSFQLCGVAVDTSGDVWLPTTGGGSAARVVEYASSGSPPAEIPGGTFMLTLGTTCRIASGAGNALYVATSGRVDKYAGAPPPTTFDPSALNVYANQSSPTGDIFTVAAGDFQEYDSSGVLLGTYGAEYVKGVFGGMGIAYDPSLDRVYVGEAATSKDPNPVVAVFGVPSSGTVPDITEIAAPSSVGISSAHLAGKVNPRSVSATAHFEWKRPSESWAAAALLHSSPPQALTPVDETEHSVEYDTKSLRGNTAYEVRLVTVNDSNHLEAFSAVEPFTTKTALAAPEVKEVEAEVKATEATVKGKVNPKGDSFDWRVEKSAGAGCAGTFEKEPLQTHEEGSATPVPVAYTMKGLLPSQHYCVRIAATNSFSATPTISETKEFTTLPVPPSEVETAFAAPRTDSSARLNGRVNPEGETLSYYFEYSEDGGKTWIELAPRRTPAKHGNRSSSARSWKT